jgi:hypothetical protein
MNATMIAKQPKIYIKSNKLKYVYIAKIKLVPRKLAYAFWVLIYIVKYTKNKINSMPNKYAYPG